jgi:hypothetical protein
MFDTNSSLSDLRQEIEEDFDLDNVFNFVHRDVVIDTADEDMPISTVGNYVDNDASAGRTVLLIQIKSFKNPSVQSTSSDQAGPDESPMPMKEPKPSTSGLNFLRSPTSLEIRRIKIYSEDEITHSKGMKKKRREYWNVML